MEVCGNEVCDVVSNGTALVSLSRLSCSRACDALYIPYPKPTTTTKARHTPTMMPVLEDLLLLESVTVPVLVVRTQLVSPGRSVTAWQEAVPVHCNVHAGIPSAHVMVAP